MIIGIVSIHFLVEEGPIARMVLFILSTFLGFKIVVANNHLGKEDHLNFRQWVLFSYAWFGMNPAPFKYFPGKPFNDNGIYIIKGLYRIIIGLLIIISTGFIFKIIPVYSFYNLEYLFYLIGLSVILHFGILNISAGLLRRLGIPVTSLFKNPVKSKSLQEFWGKRWNIAFVELTAIAVQRPLKAKYGGTVALWGAYIFSGLLHELAISLPVNAGYGKPFAYFMLQVILIVFIEKHVIRPSTNHPVRMVWLMICLFAPIFILFHRPFIHQIILPVVDAIKIY